MNSYQHDQAERDKERFLGNFSSRSRNALAQYGVFDQTQLNEIILNGKIFKMPSLGVVG